MYENIFSDMGLRVVHCEDYDEYDTEDGHSISAERVWLLQGPEEDYNSEQS